MQHALTSRRGPGAAFQAVRRFAARGLVQLLASPRALAVAGALFCIFIAAMERDAASMPFVILCGALIAAVTHALSGRWKFALYLAASLLTLSTLASFAKFRMMVINAHVFDVWFYVLNPQTVMFLASEFAPLMLAAGVAAAAFAMLSLLVWRFDRPARSSRWVSALAALACAAMLPLAFPSGADDFNYHITKRHFTSSLFASFSDLARFAGADPLAAPPAGAPAATPFEPQAACNLAAGAPDIIFTLAESSVPPAAIPGWKHDPSLGEYFKSFDGQLHRARVETYGGGTWISHASVFSGVSMADYGWKRPYATMLLRDQMRHGLAAYLAQCGYRTVVLSPQMFRFVDEGPALTALGFGEYLDYKKLGTPSAHEADAFYFGKALDYYRRHIAADRRPLLMFIMTMGAHSPYDYRMEPGRQAKGEPFGNDAETDEYLRRLTFAQEDYAGFLGEIRALNRPAVAAQFGDHHPIITRDAFERAGVNQNASDWGSKLYETFYAVTPINFAPAAALPAAPALDLAFLGVTVLEVAGIPLDAAFAGTRTLREACHGAFHTCARRDLVDLHLARLKQSAFEPRSK